jgi:hypothetical protein
MKKPKVSEYTFALGAGRPKNAARIARIAARHGVLLMVGKRAVNDWFHYFAVENAGGTLDAVRAEGTVGSLVLADLWPLRVMPNTVKRKARSE